MHLQNGEQKQQLSTRQTAINRKLTGENLLSCFQLYNRFLFIEKHKKWSRWAAIRCWSTKLATHHQKQKITIKTNQKKTKQKHCRSCKYWLPNFLTVNHFHQCYVFPRIGTSVIICRKGDYLQVSWTTAHFTDSSEIKITSMSYWALLHS